MNMSMNLRRMANLTTETPEMSVSGTEPPAFQLNFSRLMSDIGNKSPSVLASDLTSNSRGHSLGYVNQTAQDGNFLASTELGGNRAAQLIKQQNAPQPLEFNVGLNPPNPPEIRWNDNSFRIDWSGNGVKIEWEPDYMPSLEVDPRVSVEVYLRNMPKITITVEEYSSEYGNVSIYA